MKLIAAMRNETKKKKWKPQKTDSSTHTQIDTQQGTYAGVWAGLVGVSDGSMVVASVVLWLESVRKGSGEGT